MVADVTLWASAMSSVVPLKQSQECHEHKKKAGTEAGKKNGSASSEDPRHESLDIFYNSFVGIFYNVM